MALAVLSVVLQAFIDFSAQNIASACVVLASSMSILLYIGWTKALKLQPLSTFAIFGFCLGTQLGALLAQTAAWTALRSSLYAPVYTFGTLAFYQAIALAVHAAYCFLLTAKRPRMSPVRHVLDRAGLYRRPSAGTLWIMGVIGLLSFAFSNGDSVLAKFSAAFNFLTWAPFLIPIYMRTAGKSYFSATLVKPLLAIYILAVCVLGLAVNARGMLFLGVVTIGILYLFIGMRSAAPVSGAALWKIGALAAVVLAVAGPMSDLTTAMAVAREARGKISASEMIRATWDAWGRPDLIKKLRNTDKAAMSTAYDEYYIANPMLARFVETKFHDNSLHFVGLISTEDGKARLRNYTISSLWYALPSPILSALNITVNKAQLNFSMGDYIVYLSRGLPLGGQKTGSMFAQGIALLGPLFSLVYVGICLALYVLMDLLTVRPSFGIPSLSALAMMKIWQLFIYGITSESLGVMFTFIVREFLQMVLIYLLVLALATAILHRKQAATAAPGDFIRRL